MAVMWPRKLPPDVLRNPRRAAERKVYAQLQTQLGGDWVVFYSRPWLGLTATGEEIDGEADFVVASPSSGFLTIEVKGGEISHDPAAGTWISRDRDGIRHRIKNPVTQASSSKYELIKKLHELPGMENCFVHVRHGVVFPDTVSAGRALAPNMPLDIFCFRDGFARLGDWVVTRMGNPAGGEQPLGAAGILALERLLAHPFVLRVPLAQHVQEDEETLRALTPTQYRILRAIEDLPRAAIAGGAGTGKTILAVEKAATCARSGRRTLLTCMSAPLAGYLAARTRDIPGLEVMTFHAACANAISAAGMVVPDNPDSCPDLVADAGRALPGVRFDAIVVDEGQDFQPHWWAAVDDLIVGGSESLLYVFLDTNQRVYPSATHLPREVRLASIRLTENLRNTKKIHDASQRFYSGHPIQAIGPEGQDIEWVRVNARGVGPTVEAVITKLMAEKVPPGDVAILGSTALWPVGARVVGQPVVDSDSVDDRSILCDTVRRFKGLERAVVVVVADEELSRDQELAYVALSRPRTFLTVVGDEGVLARLRG